MQLDKNRPQKYKIFPVSKAQNTTSHKWLMLGSVVYSSETQADLTKVLAMKWRNQC